MMIIIVIIITIIDLILIVKAITKIEVIKKGVTRTGEWKTCITYSGNIT